MTETDTDTATNSISTLEVFSLLLLTNFRIRNYLQPIDTNG